MATDLDDYLPYDSGAGADRLEDGWRKMSRVWLPTGVVYGELNSFEVYADGTGSMQVKVKTGRTWIEGAYGESTSEKTVTLSNPHATQDRIDRIILRNHYGNNKIELDKLTGIADGSLAFPALTQNTTMHEMSIGRVSVSNAGAPYAFDVGDVVDERRFTTDRGPTAKVTQATPASTANTTDTAATFDAVAWDTAGMWSSAAPTRLTVVKAGVYFVVVWARWETGAASTPRAVKVFVNGSGGDYEQMASGYASVEPRVSWSGEIELDAGDYIQLMTYQASGGAAERRSWMSASYRCPPVSDRFPGA